MSSKYSAVIDPDHVEGFIAEGHVDEPVEERPEDAIPDLPENQGAREFLKKAPSKGLFMPLGKEVKVMQCWRCKAFGHRTGDRECPMRMTGNVTIEEQRVTREDPMNSFVSERALETARKYERLEELKRLVEVIRQEEAERKRKKMEKKEKKKEKEEKKERDKKSEEKDGAKASKKSKH